MCMNRNIQNLKLTLIYEEKKKLLALTNFNLCKGILPTSICVLSGTLVNRTSGTATAHMTWAHLQEMRQKCKQMFPKLNTGCTSTKRWQFTCMGNTQMRKEAQSTYVHHKQTLWISKLLDDAWTDSVPHLPTTVTGRARWRPKNTIIIFICFYIWL